MQLPNFSTPKGSRPKIAWGPSIGEGFSALMALGLFAPVAGGSPWFSRKGHFRLALATVWMGVLFLSSDTVLGQSGAQRGGVMRSPARQGLYSRQGAAAPQKGRPVSTQDGPKATTESGTAATTAKAPEKGQDSTRWREGHRIENVVASFQLSDSERFLASLPGDKGLTALENLALERIADAMRIDSADNRWVITGRISEFRGQNYLWIERATRAAKVAGQ